jgi:hypothetical protein
VLLRVGVKGKDVRVLDGGPGDWADATSRDLSVST